MPSYDLLIRGGVVFGVDGDFEPRRASILISDGKIAGVLPPEADVDAPVAETFDADGLYVSPGLIDSHMHDEYFQDPNTVQWAMIRQGVTTCLAGHCGLGPKLEKSMAERKHPWLHISYLVGNRALREEVGITDNYASATPSQIEGMCDSLRESLDRGALGLSFGLEYAPGTSAAEVDALSAVVARYDDRLITVHIRYADAVRCLGAITEMIDVARKHRVRVQISHLGSMTMIERCVTGGMELIDAAKREGLDVRFDCYPYDAWCGKAGSALFDDGFLETWAKNNTIEDLEAASGPFKGERLTLEKLAVMRGDDPLSLIVCHVMDDGAIRDCIAHPDCMIASDALYTGGGAHPRIAGTFPRALKTLRDKGYSWGDALKKMTVMPADSLSLISGKLCAGSVADVLVFDHENFIDHATYQDQFAQPSGVKLVVMKGHIILRDGSIEGEPRGDFYIRRSA